MNPHPPDYRHRATPQFWRSFYRLTATQKQSVRVAWRKFKVNPFDPSLGTHKIHSLSARAGTTVYSVVIESDLRAVFHIIGDTVWTIDVGTHRIYR
jgi:hypothetical protein